MVGGKGGKLSDFKMVKTRFLKNYGLTGFEEDQFSLFSGDAANWIKTPTKFLSEAAVKIRIAFRPDCN